MKKLMVYRTAYKNLKKGRYKAILNNDVRAYFNDPEGIFSDTYSDLAFYLTSGVPSFEDITANTNGSVIIPGNSLLKKNAIRDFSITSFLYRSKIYKIGMELQTKAIRERERIELSRERARTYAYFFEQISRIVRDPQEYIHISSENTISDGFKFLK